MKKSLWVHIVYLFLLGIVCAVLLTVHGRYARLSEEKRSLRDDLNTKGDTISYLTRRADSLETQIGLLNQFISASIFRLEAPVSGLKEMEEVWENFWESWHEERARNARSAVEWNLRVEALQDSLFVLGEFVRTFEENSERMTLERNAEYERFTDSLAVLEATILNLRQSMNVMTLRSDDGKKFWYLGQKNGEKAEGYGVALWPNGSVYQGTWKDNKRHGKGIHTWKDGERYEGEFADDRREGLGNYYWPNGEVYSGEWKNDRRNGFGKITDAKGRVIFDGVWVNDKLSRQTQIFVQ